MENEIQKCKGKLNFYDWSNSLAPHMQALQLGKQGCVEGGEINLKSEALCSSFGSSASEMSA